MREFKMLSGSTHAEARFVSLPMYVLLILDVANGLVSLVMPGVFTPLALGAKAVIALTVGLFVGWSVWDLALLWILLFVSAFCIVFIDVNADSLMLLMKVCSVLLLMRLIRRCVDRSDQRRVASFMVVGLLVLALSSALGLAGIGHDRYTDVAIGLRANGFLPAGNEMNIALVALFWWLSESGDIGISRRVRRTLYWLCLLMMVASFSKTTVLAAAIVMLYRSARSRWTAVAAVVLFPALLFALIKSSIWDRWVFFYNAYSEQGFLSAITAGRMARVFGLNIDAETILTKGGGVLTHTGGYIESDPLDLLYNFGIAGLILYLVFVASIWRLSASRLLPTTLIVAISVLAGHVVYSVFAVPFLVCSLVAVGRAAEVNHSAGGEEVGRLTLDRADVART